MSIYLKAYQGIDGHLFEIELKKENVLSESGNYLLYAEYESVSLCIKNKRAPMISVGDHYGNPEAGLISREEDYVVSVGYGIAIVHIKNIQIKNNRYSCEVEGFFNKTENPWYVDYVFQMDEDANEFFRFMCCNDRYDLAEYKFNTITNEVILIRVIEELPKGNNFI